MGWQQSQDSRQRTRVNTDNGHLFLAQSTDSQRRSTSLMRTLYYEQEESLREFYRGHFCQSPAPPTSFEFKPRSPNLDCIKFSKEIGEINRIVEL